MPINLVAQKIIDRTIVEVVENEKTRIFKTERIDNHFSTRFLELVEKNGRFEFMGWYNNFNLKQPLEKTTKITRCYKRCFYMELVSSEMGIGFHSTDIRRRLFIESF